MAKYPEHFKIGEGLEGLDELIDTLKKGYAKLKVNLKGNSDAFVGKPTQAVITELKATYANPAWVKDQEVTGKPVNVSTLAKALGDFQNVSGLESHVTSIQGVLGKALDQAISDTKGLWSKLQAYPGQAKGLSDDEQTKLAGEVKKTVPLPSKTILIQYQTPQPGKTKTIPGLTEQDVIALGNLMITVLTFSAELQATAADLRAKTGWDDTLYDTVESKTLADALLMRGHWEVLTEEASDFADKCSDNLLKVAQQLELVVLNSLK